MSLAYNYSNGMIWMMIYLGRIMSIFNSVHADLVFNCTQAEIADMGILK
jgi:hypothetical protein